MTSLYNRASLEQAWMLRVVEGAVKNVCDAHDDIHLPPRFGRSVAKRAVGTLTAARPITLGDGLPLSQNANAIACSRVRPERSANQRPAGATILSSRGRSPIDKMWAKITRQMRAIKDSGDIARYRAYVELLRAFDACSKLEKVE